MRARSIGAGLATGLALAAAVTFARRAWSGPADAPAPAGPEARAAFERHMAMAQEAYLAERYGEAFQQLSRAAATEPASSLPHQGLGDIYAKLALKDLAEASYRRAVELDPADRAASKGLIKTLYDVGRCEEALRETEKARARWPDDNLLRAEAALNLMRLGRAAEAVPVLEAYNAAAGKQAWGLAHLARARAETGEAAMAERGYREALALDPGMAIARFWLGQLLVTAGRRSEAAPELEAYRRARELQTREHSIEMTLLGRPDDVNVIVELARTRFLLGKHAEGLQSLERAMRLAPGDEKLRRIYEGARAHGPGPVPGSGR